MMAEDCVGGADGFSKSSAVRITVSEVIAEAKRSWSTANSIYL